MPVDNSVYVEEESGIKGALTRPLGPLPAWGWALVIVGGYFLFRILRGGSSSGGTVIGSIGAAGSTGSTGATGATGANGTSGADNTDLISSLQDSLSLFGDKITEQSGIINNLSGQVDDLGGKITTDEGVIGNLTGLINNDSSIINQLTSLTALQDKLNQQLNQKASLVMQYSYAYTALKNAQQSLANCTTTTCRTTYTAAADKYRIQAEGIQAQVVKLDTSIASLETQIKAAQPTSTAQIIAPNTSPVFQPPVQ